MVFVFFVLWTITAILLATNPKNPSTRWVAFTTFAAGGGGLSRTISETIFPYLAKHEIGNLLVNTFLHKTQIAASFMNHVVTPFCFLMFAITYSGIFTRYKRYLFFILAMPILYMFLITPMSPALQLDFQILFYWCVPYILLGIGLLLYSYIQEKSPHSKREKLLPLLVAGPPMVFQAIVNYTMRAFFEEAQEVWRYMPVVIAALFISILIFSVRFGIFGVRLRWDKAQIDRTMRSANSGAMVLNHALKNELGKIKILSDRIIQASGQVGQIHLQEDASHIKLATEHIIQMSERIHHYTQEITIEPASHSVNSIISEAVELNEAILMQRKIKTVIQGNERYELLCDKVHLVECINNILINSIEAMGSEGAIRIRSYAAEKWFVIEITDTGPGIDRTHVPHLFDPFYSTKHNKGNYGLGLAYCYNVMTKHDGVISIDSSIGEGARVSLCFPVKRTALIKKSLAKEGVHEHHPSVVG